MTPDSVLPLFSYSIIIANLTPSLVSSRFIKLPSQFHPLVCFVSEARQVPLHYLFSLASCQGRSISLYNSPVKATLYKLFMPFVEAAEKDRFVVLTLQRYTLFRGHKSELHILAIFLTLFHLHKHNERFLYRKTITTLILNTIINQKTLIRSFY